MMEEQGFRISLDMTEFYSGIKAQCFIYVDLLQCRLIKDIEEHIKKSFNINDAVLLTSQSCYLPSLENVRVLHDGDKVKVAPVDKEFYTSTGEIENSGTRKRKGRSKTRKLSESMNGVQELFADGCSKKRKRNSCKMNLNDIIPITSPDVTQSEIEAKVVLDKEESPNQDEDLRNVHLVKKKKKKRKSRSDIGSGNNSDKEVHDDSKCEDLEHNAPTTLLEEFENAFPKYIENNASVEMVVKSLNVIPDEIEPQFTVVKNRRQRIRKRKVKRPNDAFLQVTPKQEYKYEKVSSGNEHLKHIRFTDDSCSTSNFEESRTLTAASPGEVMSPKDKISLGTRTLLREEVLNQNSVETENIQTETILQGDGLLPSEETIYNQFVKLLSLRNCSKPRVFERQMSMPTSNREGGCNRMDEKVDFTTNQIMEDAKPHVGVYPLLTGHPRVNDIINFKILRLGEDYTPQLSSKISGKVEVYCSASHQVTLQILEGEDQCQQPGGKFATEEEVQTEGKHPLILNFTMEELIEPRLMYP